MHTSLRVGDSITRLNGEMPRTPVADNYDAFMAVADASLKSALSKRMLEHVSKELEPRARQGYDSQYLGELNRKRYKVYLWRLKFKDGGDDALTTLSVKDGKAGSFLLQ